VRGDEQRLVGALLLGEPAGKHVAGVGERLEAVEHARRRVGDGRDAGRRGPGRQRLGDRDPAAAARHDQAQQRLRLARPLDQRERLRAQRLEVRL
jgi:hypothetical protein